MVHEKTPRRTGFTLVEFLIAMGLAAVILTVVAKLFTMSQWSYSMQEQISEMHHNAHYTVKKLTEVLSQAGADLPTNGLEVIRTPFYSASSFRLCRNSRGGVQIFSTAVPSTIYVPVDDAGKFVETDSIVRLRAGVSPEIYRIVSVDSVKDSLILGSSQSFSVGDTIYGFTADYYFLNGTDLCLGSTGEVIAENIDSLNVQFMDLTSTGTNTWNNMSFIKLYVTARTEQPDPEYNVGDGYRRVTLTMDFRLRNKF